ncbi:MAG: hypothetical protein FJW30_06525 [Acidobacteria bacterium]|nr:hypothetical protein [Acidobacteriota bacterium]
MSGRLPATPATVRPAGRIAMKAIVLRAATSGIAATARHVHRSVTVEVIVLRGRPTGEVGTGHPVRRIEGAEIAPRAPLSVTAAVKDRHAAKPAATGLRAANPVATGRHAAKGVDHRAVTAAARALAARPAAESRSAGPRAEDSSLRSEVNAETTSSLGTRAVSGLLP